MMEAESVESTQLRTASSLRLVYTKKNKEIKNIDVQNESKKAGKGNEEQSKKKHPGRKQTEQGLLNKRKTELIQEQNKKLKTEWGKAFKHIVEEKKPVYPIFMNISECNECRGDQFYLKIFREMAYGVFPKGIFYDAHRGTMVCTEPQTKRNTQVKKQYIDKYIRVCLPLRPPLELKVTKSNTKMESWDDRENTIENPELLMLDDREDIILRKSTKYINRSYQRLELPIVILNDIFKLSVDRLYQEIKLFVFMTIDVLSPSDSVLMQKDSCQIIESGELTTSLKSQKPWKKFNRTEKLSLLCQYCRIQFIINEGKYIDKLSLSQYKLLRDIEDYVCTLYITGIIKDEMIEYNGNTISSISNVQISSTGVILNYKSVTNKINNEPEGVYPVVFQKYKNVGIQKISNGIAKQSVKFSKLVNDLTNIDEDEM